ncbi:MAG: sodium:proton antiporter [Bifidobacteriaceae bacterium]|nr:sodium:proton antiporter [Bifidobacteriaceae bacterium]
MEAFNLILAITGVVVISSFISRFLPRISMPLVQILLGIILSQTEILNNVELDPKLFVELFIAPLLYLEAREINKQALFKNLKLSLSLAIGLAIATMVAVGFTLHALWPAISLAAALALGAALGPTDAVAVSSLSNEASLSDTEYNILKSESLFNDASGIVGFQFAIAAAVTGVFSVGSAAEEFVISFIGGTVVGFIVGLLSNWIFETIRNFGMETTTTRILMELFLPFLLYIESEEVIHVSGILAVVTAGIVTRFDQTGINPDAARTNIVANSVWKVLSYSLNGAVFVLLGLQLPDALAVSWHDKTIGNKQLIIAIALVTFIVITMRYFWVYGMLRISKRLKPSDKTGNSRLLSAALMTIGGPKGTITLALIFTLPYYIAGNIPFPMRNALIFIASGVIIATLLLANFALPLLSPKVDTDIDGLTKTTITVMQRTVDELNKRTTDENKRAMTRVINAYNNRIMSLEQNTGNVHQRERIEQLQVQAINWEKDYIKVKLVELKENPEVEDYELKVEAYELIMDRLMETLRHIENKHVYINIFSNIRGRIRKISHRAMFILRRLAMFISKNAANRMNLSVNKYVRMIQIEAVDYILECLHKQENKDAYGSDACTALTMQYLHTKAVMQARPNRAKAMQLIQEIQDLKRESFSIELNVINEMQDANEITRAEAKELRSNVYVMQVDADSEI